jgi:anti-anti-sigma factor
VPIIDTEITDGLFTLCQADEGDVIRLSLEGELDLSNAKTFEAGMQEALASGSHVLIDLRKLEFLDSTGISLFVEAIGGKAGDRLTFLPSNSPNVCRLLKLTGLEERLSLSSPQPSAQA